MCITRSLPMHPSTFQQDGELWCAQGVKPGDVPLDSGSADPPDSASASAGHSRSVFAPLGVQLCSQPRCPSPGPGYSQPRLSDLARKWPLFLVEWEEQLNYNYNTKALVFSPCRPFSCWVQRADMPSQICYTEVSGQSAFCKAL